MTRSRRRPIHLPALAAAAALAALAGCSPQRPAPPGAFDPDSVADAYTRPTAALMWPGATRGFQITPDGDLYNGDWYVRLRCAAGASEAPPPRRIAFEDRWRPVAHWRRSSSDVRWDFEAVALPEPAPRDSGLLVSLEVTATNTSSGTASCILAADFALPDTVPPFVAFDAPESPWSPFRWASRASPDTVYGWSDGASSGPALEHTWTLAPRESRRLRLVLPAYPATASALARWARTPHARRVAEARRYWDEAVSRGAQFRLNERATEDALRAALVVLLSCRERRGPLWVPIGGPFHYRDVWLRDGARAIAALAVAGFTREARELAAGLAGMQWPQGAFVTHVGQLDGTGLALWAFEQALLRPARDDSVSRYADVAIKAWKWFEWQRGMGRVSGWEYGTLVPFADPRDNELTRTRLAGNDAWAIAGYRAAARLLAAAKRDSEARVVERSRDDYVADFRQALERNGSGDVPPCWQGAGRDWGNLSVTYPCGVLPAADPRCAALARRVWATAGGAGLCSYGRADSLHYYVGADLGTWALLAGWRAAADSVLEAMLRWRSASGTAGEVFAASGDFGRNLPPHPTSAAALVTLVRNALVYDDDADTLRLTLGARAAWWADGGARGAPTRWGRLDLEFRHAGAAAEWKWTAVPVWTSLTLPPGTRLDGPPPPPLVRGAADDVVLAPPGTRSASVRVERVAGTGP